jgi:hypothetical protein
MPGPLACRVCEPARGVGWHSTAAGTVGGLPVVRSTPTMNCRKADDGLGVGLRQRVRHIQLATQLNGGAAAALGQRIVGALRLQRSANSPPDAGQTLVNRALPEFLGQQNGLAAEARQGFQLWPAGYLRCRSASRLRSRSAGRAQYRRHGRPSRVLRRLCSSVWGCQAAR